MAKRKSSGEQSAKYRARLARLLATTGETPYQRRMRLGREKGLSERASTGREGSIKIGRTAKESERHFIQQIDDIPSPTLRSKVYGLYKEAKREGWKRSKKDEPITSMDRLLWVLANHDNPRIFRGTSSTDQSNFDNYLNAIMQMVGKYPKVLEDEELDGVIAAQETEGKSLYSVLRADGIIPDRRPLVKMKKRKKQ